MSSSTDKIQGGEKPTSPWRWLALIIAVSPILAALGYGITYLYEWGYCNVFRIPMGFIQISPANVLLAGGAVLGVGVLITFVLGMAYFAPSQSWFKKLGPVWRRLTVSLPFLSIPLIYMIRWPLIWPEALMLFIMTSYFPAILLLGPLFGPKNAKSYRERLQAQSEMMRTSTEARLIDIIERLVGKNTIPILVLIGMLLTTCYVAGRGDAMNQKDFLLPSTYPQSVVLRIYGDNLVCAPFEKDTKLVAPSFFIIHPDDDPKPVLTWTKVGPLRPGILPEK